MVVVDLDSVIVKVNAAGRALLAADESGLLGRSFTDLCADELSRRASLLVVEFAEVMGQRTQQVEVVTGAGRRVRVELCAEPVRDRRQDPARDPVQELPGRGLVQIHVREVGSAVVAGQRQVILEGWYRQLAECLPDTAVAVFDRQLAMVVVAGAAVRANGNDPEAMTGKPLAETVTPAVLRMLQGPYEAAVVHGQSSELELTDPSTGRFYRMLIRPITDSDGTVVGGMSVTQDVSEARARDAQLAQIRAFTQLGSGVYDARTGWRFDPELLRLWGFPGEYDSNTFRYGLIVPEDRAATNAAWDGIYAHGGQVTTQYRIRHGITGQLRHLECTFAGEVNPDGVLVSAVVTHIDVTGSVTAREAEQEAKALAADGRTALLRQVSDLLGTSAQTVEEVTQSVTDLAAAVLGDGAVLRVLQPDQASVERDVVAHRIPANRVQLAAAMRSTAPVFSPDTGTRAEVITAATLVSSINPGPHHGEYQRDIADRVDEPVEHFIVAPVRHEGAVLGLLAVYRTDPDQPYQRGDDDMVQVLADRVGSTIAAGRAVELARTQQAERDKVSDELHELTAEQYQLREQLAQTEARERAMLAEAVHDDPLQLIVAAILRVDLLQMHARTEDEQELDAIADLLEASVDKLRQLIVTLAPLDLSEGLGGALHRLAQGIFVGTSVTVHQEGAAHVHLSQNAKTTVYRIAREALVNARKHAKADNVTITLSDDPDAVTVTVTDDGVGVTSLNAGPGHLGLATMRARARTENAHLDITSTPGRGTTVSLTIPASSNPHSAAKAT